MYRKPFFWVAFAIMAVVCVFLTATFFSRAFPIVTIDLRVDRETALNASNTLALQYGWGPSEFEQAASFGLDSSVQTYVELEGGGTEAFAELLSGDLYSPYTWHVRHFKEGETTETNVWFKPSGEPYGFTVTLPEDQPGESLTSDAARAIAETQAREEWKINLNQYNLIEQSQENRPGGRTDHTFTYERPDERIADARFRMKLSVSGSQFSALTHFVKIPESFSRNYEEMRSANDTIAFGATVAMGILYILGGCVVGLFFLLRDRWVLFRSPLRWGLLIGFLQFAAGINQLPLAWMDYDTALSAPSFLAREIAQVTAGAILMAILLTLTFMAAESLSRRAFPHHIQQWKLWSSGVANTSSVLGRTSAGYLLVGFFFAYEVGLYFFSSELLGWWTPSEALFHPDTLATYFPWLTSIAVSAQAGFWEESLFRAIPIAGAALLGQRFGARKAWIIGAVILQALVFGAGHANYPAQPSYARLVELIIPSLCFAFLYLRWGILTSVVLHFAFDVVWFALPLFVSTAPGIWFDRSMVAILTLIPLWVLLIVRWRNRSWVSLSPEQLNSSWVPKPATLATPSPLETPTVASALTPTARWGIACGGVLGLSLWIFGSDFTSDVPPLQVGRTHVEQIARDRLGAMGVQLQDPWKAIVTVDAPLNENDEFVWREGGPEAYRKLIGTYLGPPYWKVRFVRFVGDVADRAEEYEVMIEGSGKVFRVRHQLPEDKAGATIPEAGARRMVEEAIRTNFKLEPSQLRFISSEPSRQPNRQDWIFTYANDEAFPLEQGEARLVVEISGDELTDAYRYVYVPEEWLRQERNRKSMLEILQMSSSALLGLLIFAGAVIAIVNWSRKQFAVRPFVYLLICYFTVNSLNLVNKWPTILSRFSTAQPFQLQAVTAIVGSLVAFLFVSAAVGLIVGVAHYWRGETAGTKEGQSAILIFVLSGTLLAGFAGLVSTLSPDLMPHWPEVGSAATSLPLAGSFLDSISSYLLATSLLLFVVAAIRQFTAQGRRRTMAASIILILLGLFLTGTTGIDTLTSWLLSGLAAGILFLLFYHSLLNKHLEAIPVIVGVLTLLGLVKQAAYQAYAGSVLGNALAMVGIVVATVIWSKALQLETGTAEAAATEGTGESSGMVGGSEELPD